MRDALAPQNAFQHLWTIKKKTGHTELKNCGAQSLDENGQTVDAYVEVQVANLGSIGTFATFAGPAVGNETWFRYSEDNDESPKSQIASHAWGL